MFASFSASNLMFVRNKKYQVFWYFERRTLFILIFYASQKAFIFWKATFFLLNEAFIVVGILTTLSHGPNNPERVLFVQGFCKTIIQKPQTLDNFLAPQTYYGYVRAFFNENQLYKKAEETVRDHIHTHIATRGYLSKPSGYFFCGNLKLVIRNKDNIYSVVLFYINNNINRSK